MQRPDGRFLKVAVVMSVVICLAVAQLSGLFDLFQEPARVKQALVRLGPWGYAAFIAAYAALQPFAIPGTVFILAAPLIWPWPIAFAVSMVGTMAASVIGFSFARFVARDWVSRRIPKRLKKYEEALNDRAFVTVATLRFIFWMPPWLHAFFGISGVGFWIHFWASAAGYLVPLLLTSYFGERVFQALRDARVETWLALGVLAILFILGFWAVRKRKLNA